jgi:hypothetical protein
MMPEPSTVPTRKAVPRNSAVSLRENVMVPALLILAPYSSEMARRREHRAKGFASGQCAKISRVFDV